MTLKEYKDDLRAQISASKEMVSLYKHETSSVDKKSGHYAVSSKYEAKCLYEGQLDILKWALSQANKVRRLR